MIRRLRTIAPLLGATLLFAACSTAPAESGADEPADNGSGSGIAVPADLEQSGTLRLAMFPGILPWTDFKDGELAGADRDLGDEIARRLGLEASWQQIDFGALITSLNGGRIDATISGMWDTKEREATVDFVDYYKSGWGFLVKEGNPLGLESLADLCGHRAAAGTGTAGVEVLEQQDADCKQAGEPGIEITAFTSPQQLQLAVRTGRTDADLESFDNLSHVASTLDGGSMFDAVEVDEITPNYYGVGVAKGRDELVAAIQEALQSMIDDGTYAEILRSYDIPESGDLETVTVNGAER